MLKSLHISNYALIDRVDIELGSGFNVITGETGAGKSIILGALSLILGGRADTRVVADRNRKSVVEAQFVAEGYSDLDRVMEANDLDREDSLVILRREITPSGRSRAFVNDTPVALTVMREVALHLVDIHSQHRNQLLADPAYQMEIIDNLAGNEERLRSYRTKYKALRSAMKKLKTMREQIRKESDDADFTRYQFEQIDSLGLYEGEQEDLERERDILADVNNIKSHVFDALQALSDADSNAVAMLGTATEALSGIEEHLAKDDNIIERLESVAIELDDIASTLHSFDNTLSADPGRLEAVEERLNTIYALQQRHNVDSTEALLEIRDNLAEKLESVDNGGEILADLEKEARKSLALVKEAAAELTDARKATANRFADDLRAIAAPLGMSNLRCEVRVSPADISSTGADKVEFLFAFNKNQAPLPVGATASGGEISRLMLSIKSIIARHMQIPSIIFDEIDTGVSGEVASRMGAMMRDISAAIQVTAITHLPQVAALGNSHYKVYKADDEESTHTFVKPLADMDTRIMEIAKMLSGADPAPEALANARILLEARQQ